MKTKELLDLQMNVDTQDSEESNLNEDVTRYIPIDETPFALVKDGDVWVIVMGNNLVSSKKFIYNYEAINYIEDKPWELIMNASFVYNSIVNELKNEEEEK